jgi:hypothetical protein
MHNLKQAAQLGVEMCGRNSVRRRNGVKSDGSVPHGMHKNKLITHFNTNIFGI